MAIAQAENFETLRETIIKFAGDASNEVKVKDVDIGERLDHSGDQALSITIILNKLPRSSEKVAKYFSTLHRDLRQYLSDANDDRFPYMTLVIAEEWEKVGGGNG